jgi:hypothetical protein
MPFSLPGKGNFKERRPWRTFYHEPDSFFGKRRGIPEGFFSGANWIWNSLGKKCSILAQPYAGRLRK